MFQTSRHFLRFVVLSIGFLLFVFATFRAAESASNPQAVVGKPNLLPISQVNTSETLGAVVSSGVAALQPTAVSNPAVTSPSTTTDSTSLDTSNKMQTANVITDTVANTTDHGKHLALGHDKQDK